MVLIDLFLRKVFGWEMRDRRTAELVTEALKMALRRRKML